MILWIPLVRSASAQTPQRTIHLEIGIPQNAVELDQEVRPAHDSNGPSVLLEDRILVLDDHAFLHLGVL
jgi:hypothetical protein